MADKPLCTMTDDELRAELTTWENHVTSAAGWSSAHYAAKVLAQVVTEGNRRKLGFVNKYPIINGSGGDQPYGLGVRVRA